MFAFILTLFEIFMIDEFLFILKQMSYNSSKINDEINVEIESIDKIFVFEFDKWIVVIAKKKIFDYINTFDEITKNSFAFDIQISNNSFDWSRCNTVDMKTLNQEVFALIAMYDAFSKNPPALSPEDLEISVVMDMPSLKHLMDMDGPAIEAFDSGTAMDAPSKNSSIQHTEDPETLEKDSTYTYELPALPAFDPSIDIDFEAYTMDTEAVIQRPVASSRPFRGLALRHNSFGWSSCCTNPIGSRTSSVPTCTSASAVTSIDTVDTEFCEGEQSSCSSVDPSVSDCTECTTVVDTDFYGGEQSSCSRTYVTPTAVAPDAVVVFTDTDAPTLTAGLVNTTMNSAWISLLGPVVDLAPKPKHKGLPKVKIK